MDKPKKKAPVKFKFYGDKEYKLEKTWAREYSDGNAIATAILYRINTVTTKSHALYGETKTKNKKFLPPIVLNITVNIEDIVTEFVAKGGIMKETVGGFNFGVYLDELDEKNCQINRGDYVKYNDGEKDRFYELYSVDNIKSNNSMLGYKPYYQLVQGVMVLENVITEE